MKKPSQAFMDTEVTVPLPHIAAVILACLAGAAQVVNQALINVPGNWHAYIGLGVATIALLGVKPLVGDQFRSALHLPAWVSQSITALVGAATIAAGQLTGEPAWVQSALAATVTVMIALGFGPAASPVADAAKLRRSAKRAAARKPVVVAEPVAEPVA